MMGRSECALQPRWSYRGLHLHPVLGQEQAMRNVPSLMVTPGSVQYFRHQGTAMVVSRDVSREYGTVSRVNGVVREGWVYGQVD